MPYAGQVDKTMGADTVGHLKLLLETELKRAREESNLDIAMFLGVDGRIFSSSIPNQLDPREYRLLNLLKGSLAHICNQLSGQNMMMSVQQFEAGTIIISGVGDRAFLVFLTSKPVEITKMQTVLANVVKTSIVVRHLFESKPITPEVLDDRRRPRLPNRGHDREGRGRGRGRVLAAGWRQPRGADGQGGVPRLDLLQCRGPGGSDGLQHRGGGHAAHGHGDHGRRRRRRRVPVRDAPVLLHTHDLPDALRRRTDEPRGPGRHGSVQRERPRHRRLQFLRLPRTVPGGDREERDRRREPARVLPPRHPRLERRDEDLVQERRAGEYQRGPRPGAAPELRVRVRARPPRGAAQGGAVRCPPTPGCRTAIRSWRSRRICSSKTSRERSGSRV